MEPVRIDVAGERELPDVRAPFREYADSPGFGLGFRGFAEKRAGLAGAYAPPSGCLLLATAGGAPAGCAALKPLGHGTCETKRLYVRPSFRGGGLGRLPAVRLIAEARRLGYERMRPGAVAPAMPRAVALYRDLGLVEIPPFDDNPLPGARFLEPRSDGDAGRR